MGILTFKVKSKLFISWQKCGSLKVNRCLIYYHANVLVRLTYRTLKDSICLNIKATCHKIGNYVLREIFKDNINYLSILVVCMNWASISVKLPEAKCCKSRSESSHDHVISTEPLSYSSAR